MSTACGCGDDEPRNDEGELESASPNSSRRSATAVRRLGRTFLLAAHRRPLRRSGSVKG